MGTWRYDRGLLSLQRFHDIRMTPTTLTHLDLTTDPAAHGVVKDETVTVQFAEKPGSLMSLEGPNRYAPGDALITGVTGERWVVSRDRFDAKYVSHEDRKSTRLNSSH